MDMKVFGTPELGLGTFLLAKGIPFLHVEPATDGRGVFVFQEVPYREELCQSFWTGKASVEPESYRAALNRLKFAIRSLHERGGPPKGEK
jgi:hypothetical protein